MTRIRWFGLGIGLGLLVGAMSQLGVVSGFDLRIGVLASVAIAGGAMAVLCFKERREP